MYDLKQLSLNELKQICRENKIKGFSKLNKNEIIDLLENQKELIGSGLKNFFKRLGRIGRKIPIEKKTKELFDNRKKLKK